MKTLLELKISVDINSYLATFPPAFAWHYICHILVEMVIKLKVRDSNCKI